MSDYIHNKQVLYPVTKDLLDKMAMDEDTFENKLFPADTLEMEYFVDYSGTGDFNKYLAYELYSDYGEECFDNNPQFFHSYSFYKNKPKRRIIKKGYASKDYVETALEESIKYTANKSSEIFINPIPKIEAYLRQTVDVYSRKSDLPQPNKELIQELCNKYYSKLSDKRELRYEYSYIMYEHDLAPELLESIKSSKLVRA